MLKNEKYQLLLKQVKALKEEFPHELSLLANTLALLNQEFHFSWIGFYFFDDVKNKLYLGPFQGGLACMSIPNGKGACGDAFHKKAIINVPDVRLRENYIPCSAATRSEIVIPFKGKVYHGVLDIDSIELDSFDQVDEKYLAELMNLVVS